MRTWLTMLDAVSTSGRVAATVVRAMLCRAAIFASLSIWFASGVTSATSLTWSISGGTFADGGTLAGTFVRDPARLQPSTWSVNVAGGGSSFPAHSYTPTNSGVLMLDWPPNTELTYHFIDSNPAKRQIRLTPASPLDGSAATVPLSLLGQGAVECFNCAPFRDITAGSLVLTSVTPTLSLVSIAPDPTVVGASTTATISIDAVAAFGPPTGSVTIFDTAGDTICAFTLPATSCSFAPTVPGGLTLFARYTGDTNYLSATSNELSFSTVPAAVTAVTLEPLLPNPTMIGAATTATVHVATVAGFGPPTGLITVFLNGNGNTLCTITLPATTCTFAPTTGGDQPVGSQYSGDAKYASGFSNVVVMTVAPVPPVVNLVSVAPNPTAVGTATTATVTVGTNPLFGPPSGTITVFGKSGNSLCTITLPSSACNFTPTTPGTQTVIARYDGDANYGSGLSNAVALIVRSPPMIAKAFAPRGILVSGTTTLTFTITNPNAGTALTGVGFTDAFPAGVQVAATPNATATGCGSPTFAPAVGNISVAFSGGTIAANGTCTATVDVTGTTGGLKSNVTSAVTSTEGGTGGTATAFLVVVAPPVVAPPTIAKAFGAPSIVVNATTTLTFTLTNPNPGTALTGVGFTDTLPAGLTVVDGTSSACGGTLTASGGNAIALAGATIAVSGTCTFPVTVTGTTAGVKNNTTGAVTSSEGGTGGTASASLVVVAPPTITKSFSRPGILVNETTKLTFTLANPNTGTALSEVGFTDTLPSGLVVATPNGLASSCGGTVTAAAGSGSIGLVKGGLAAIGTCTVTADVTATTGGLKNNATSGVTSAEGGTGGTAVASLVVVSPPAVAPPTIAKAFGAPIAVNETTALTFTLTNPNQATTLTGVGFTDTLPAGIAVVNGSIPTCGGALTTSGGNTITLAGATMAATKTCMFSVTVTATTAGTKNNVTSAVTSNEGGVGAIASASLTVAAIEPPTIAKAFGLGSMFVNGTTTLTFTLTNPNAVTALSGVGFTDTLPAGLVVAAPNGLTSTCGGTTTAVAGSGSVALANGGLPAEGSCTIVLNVTATTAGTKNNITSAVTSSEGGTGGTASASITVVSGTVSPTIAKTFGTASIALSGTTTLTFTLTNPNATALTVVSFNDALPAGLVVATPNGLIGACGGTVTAVAGSGSVALANGGLAAGGSCAIALTVIGTTAGIKNNSTSAVISSEGGVGGIASASLVVGAGTAQPPTIAKTFGSPSILVNGTTTLTFTLSNPNAANALTGVGFTDALPAGLVIATPNALASSCGGTVTAVAGSASVALASGGVAAGGSCTITVNVIGLTGGLKGNVIGGVTSTEGGTGGIAVAFLVVAAPPAVAPPTIAKVFGAASIVANGTTSLTFTLTNPNPGTGLSGVSFTDALPAGLVVSNPNGLTNTCGGTVTAVAGSGSMALANGGLAAGGSCAVVLNVTGATTGIKNNTTGAVTSAEGGAGGTASASIAVTPGALLPPTIAKAFGAASVVVNGTTTLTFTLTNPNAATALTGVGFIDTLPAGMVVDAPNGLTGSCDGGTITATPNGTSISLANAALAAGTSCVFAINVRGVATGNQVNTTSAVSSANGGNGNAATASIAVSSVVLAPIPTLSSLALAALALAVLLIGLRRKRAS